MVRSALDSSGLRPERLELELTESLLMQTTEASATLAQLRDLGVRLAPTTNELKLGVVTAFLGVPVFLVHLMRERRLW